MVPEITDELKQIAALEDHQVVGGQVDLLLEFLRNSIREHDEWQLPVDAEWLDATGFEALSNSSNERLWRYKPSALSTVVIDVSWIDTGEEEQWTLFVNNHYFASDPTRKDVTDLLRIVGGGE